MTRPDRRSILAAAGSGLATALAGCGLLENDDQPREFSSDNVRSVLTDPAPDVSEPVPVEPTESAIREQITAVEDLLGTVPESLDAGDVPNGVLRRELRELRAEALEEREAIPADGSRYRRLREVLRARHDSGEAAWAYRAATDEVTPEDALAAAADISDRAETALSELEYRGDRRDRTLYVMAVLESVLDALSIRQPRRLLSVEPSPLDIGRLGGSVERERGVLAVVEHLRDRHRARLSESRSFATVFEGVLDRSLTAADERSIPEDTADSVETDVADTVAEELLWAVDSARDSREAIRKHRSAGRLAAGLRSVYEFESEIRVLESVREQIERGDVPVTADVSAVRAARERALAAAESVSVDVTAPTIPAAIAAETIGAIGDTDERLRHGTDHGTVSERTLAHRYSEYHLVAQRLAALPAAAEAVRDRFPTG